MSRIGKLPIHIPQGVTVAVSPDNTVTVKGPKGQLSQQVSADLTVTVEENEVHVARHTEDKEHKAQHGLYRALLHNMVVGVSEGYTIKQELVGVGYRANAEGQVIIGEVNQDATSGNITGRGMGFINKFKELAEADGKKVAVVGNEYYVNLVENNAKEADADIIIEVAVPAQTTVELSATEASNIMNKKDTIAMFGSNQVTAEGLLTANQNLDVLGAGDGKILGVGFDAGSTQKAAVKDGTLLGSVTQAPVDQGRIAIETLNDICEGKEVKDVETACYWYDAETMEDAEIAPNLYD